MNDVKVTRVFREAWIFVAEYYFVWLKGLLLVGIPLAVLGWFLFPLVSSWSYRSILVLTCLAFIIAFGFAYINKFALTVIRNPQMVKLYFGYAVWYSISDGLLTRLFYSFIVSAVQVLILYMGWSAIGINLGVASLFAFYRRAVSPEAIVITSSRDNLAKPLSFYGCLRKSVLLMKERRGRYVLLSFFLASFGGLIGLGTHLLMDLIRQYIGPLLGELDDLLGLIQMIPVLVFSSFYCVFVLVVRTVFADTLMENDAEVVDFGD